MRKTIKQSVPFCDACKKQADYVTKCMECGKEFCWSCAMKLMVVYKHAVFLQGSEDGNYCKKCDSKLTDEGMDCLYLAFREIKRLRAEHDAWYDSFSKRRQQAESHLKRIPRPE
jgi:hypothetical protein